MHKAFFKTPILRYAAGLEVLILVHVFIMCGSIGGGGGGELGVRIHPGKSQNYICFSNTGLDPQENYKATKPAFIVGLSLAC